MQVWASIDCVVTVTDTRSAVPCPMSILQDTEGNMSMRTMIRKSTVIEGNKETKVCK